MFAQFKTLPQLFDFFKDEETCMSYWEQIRWNGVTTCPHCETGNPYTTNRGYKCRNIECQKKFTAIVGTIFENTKLPLRAWFGAIWLTTTSSKGISSLNLSKQLGITQKSAWFVLSRIREMFASTQPDMLLTGIVEVDETYIGGKDKNKSKSKRAQIKAANAAAGKRAGSYNPIETKTAVLGILERGGKVRVQPMVATNRETLEPILTANISKDATLVTDGWQAYKKIGSNYKLHVVVNHAQDEWTNGEFSTNTIEGFWSIFKRGIIGVYHQTSPKHLHRYCDEFSYRYNTRKEQSNEKFAEAIRSVVKARITYNTLIGK